MASPTVPVCSASPQENRPMYAGELISSLVAMVERANRSTDIDDHIMLERELRVGHLTIDEVLDESRRSR